MSAGIGSHIKTRSLGDAIRNGLIAHQGKLPYYRSLVGAVGANLQNGRGGACTEHYTAYDPEVETLTKLKNQTQVESKKIRGMDYSFGSNKFFARKVAKNEDVMLFSYADAPELYEAQYSSDPKLFETLYNEYESNPLTKKTYINARDLVVSTLTEAYETGRSYLHFTDEINHHTPFLDPIYSSNLCQEIALPTKGYRCVSELYRKYQEGDGEIALCSLGGIVVANIENDEQYAEVAYYTLKMISKCIHKSDYVFQNLSDTAKSRMNAGVGVMGLAHLMAKKKLKYSSQEGKNFMHELAETHSWHLINASLRIGKESGNAPWMHKTKWPQGWLPIDTYNKNVDKIVTVGLTRDWEDLRSKIIANGGIAHSSIVAHMPGESSSQAAGTTNSIYPIRDFSLLKTSETTVNSWIAPDSTKLKDYYELAWDIPTDDLIDGYAIWQKFGDQSISADLYRKLIGSEKVGTSEMISIYLNMVRKGMKTRYYQNSKTSAGYETGADDVGCAGGSCTL